MTDQAERKSAERKVLDTLKQLSEPPDDAGGLELSLATMAMGLEHMLPQALAEAQAQGKLDDFLLQLARWIAWHRSDGSPRAVVVLLPGNGHAPLPAGTRLHALDAALEEAAELPELSL